MCFLDILQIINGLDRRRDLPLCEQLKQSIEIRLERLLIAIDIIELCPPPTETEVFRQKLRGGGNHRSVRFTIQAIQIATVSDQDSVDAKDRIRFIPAFEPEGVEDCVRATNIMHLVDPILICVHEWGCTKFVKS